MKRRDFLTTTAGATAGVSMISSPVGAAVSAGSKKRVVLVGTGIRGVGFWGKRIVDNYSDIVEFVGLCDINPGRLEFAKNTWELNALFTPTSTKWCQKPNRNW